MRYVVANLAAQLLRGLQLVGLNDTTAAVVARLTVSSVFVFPAFDALGNDFCGH